jgi:hypothetical protein
MVLFLMDRAKNLFSLKSQIKYVFILARIDNIVTNVARES